MLMAGLFGGIVAGFTACVIADGAISLGMSGGTVTILCVLTSGVSAPMWTAFIAGFLIGALIAAIYHIVDCLNQCKATQQSGGGGIDAIDSRLVPHTVGPDQPLDCATAQTMLANANAKLAALRQERDAQQQRVNQAASRLQTARNAQRAALLAVLATPFWNPWAFALAVAAFGAATGMVLKARANLAKEQAALFVADAAFRAAGGAVGAAQALVNQLCPQAATVSKGGTEPVVTPTTPVVTIPGITLGTGLTT